MQCNGLRIVFILCCWVLALTVSAKGSYESFGSFVEAKKARILSKPSKVFSCKENEGLFVPGQLIIKFKNPPVDNLSINNHQKTKTLHNKRVTYRKLVLESRIDKTSVNNQTTSLSFKQNMGLDRLYLMTLDDKYDQYKKSRVITVDDCLELMEVIDELKADPDIELVEPNLVYKLMATTNDPLLNGNLYPPGLWGLDKIDVETAWELSQGSGVTVAVIDSGVDWGHPDLSSNIPDIGHDYIYNDRLPEDGLGHGTHVAGTIAAVGNNSRGMVGVAYKAKILPIRIISEYDGASSTGASDLINSLSEAISSGAAVINLSIGNQIYNSQFVEQACDLAYQSGALIIAASGNGGDDQIGDNELFYPAAYSSVMSVGASDQNDSLSSFSNYGASWVDVAAPGEQILSTFSNRAYLTCKLALSSACLGPADYSDSGSTTFGYVQSRGTSMATPHVSGLAALLRAYSAELSVDDIYGIISITTDPLSGGNTIANGRINAGSALSFAQILKANRTIDRNLDYIISDDELLSYAWSIHRYGKYYYEFFDINNDSKYDLNDVALIHQTVINYLEQADYDNFFQYVACLNAVDLHYDAFISSKEKKSFRQRINSFIKRGKYSTIYDVDDDGLVSNTDLSLIISAFARLGITV